ncbi:MAG: hypothetical protein RL748_4054 [Pseudomonadota bacterium]
MTAFETMIESHASPFHHALMQSSISAEEISDALEQMLKSDVFKRARRMCRLLRYLVEQSIYGSKRDMCEYAIGLEVFDRNPATYYPGEDPVVRVQVGRLRDRLKEYYSNYMNDAKILFSIPLGNYCPKIQRKVEECKSSHTPPLIALVPLQYIAEDIPGRNFTEGVNQDLSFHLYKAFGTQLVAAAALNDMATGKTGHEPDQFGMASGYMLEGGIQLEMQRIKVNIRLIDVHTHTIIWSQQYVENCGVSLLLQEQLAGRICVDVQQCLTLAQSRMVS